MVASAAIRPPSEEDCGGAPEDPPIRVTQETLCRLLGCSRPTVNQQLKRLERGGLIRMDYGRVEIVDKAGLLEICGGAAHTYF